MAAAVRHPGDGSRHLCRPKPGLLSLVDAVDLRLRLRPGTDFRPADSRRGCDPAVVHLSARQYVGSERQCVRQLLRPEYLDRSEHRTGRGRSGNLRPRLEVLWPPARKVRELGHRPVIGSMRPGQNSTRRIMEGIMRRGLVAALVASAALLAVPALAQEYHYVKVADIYLPTAPGHGDIVTYDPTNGMVYVSLVDHGFAVVDTRTSKVVHYFKDIQAPNGNDYDANYVYVAEAEGLPQGMSGGAGV